MILLMLPVFSLLSALCFLLLRHHQQTECRQLHREEGIHTGTARAARPTTPHWTAPGRPAMAWTGKMPGEAVEISKESLRLNDAGGEARRTD